MSETVLLLPEVAHPYGLVLAAQLARALEREGARAVLLARETAAGWTPPGLTLERARGGLALAAHRTAVRYGARRIVNLGALGSWVLPARAVRTIVLLRTSATAASGPLLARWHRALSRFAARRLFSGWPSLVTDPYERVFLRERFTLFPPITALTWEDGPPAAGAAPATLEQGTVLVLRDQLEEIDDLAAALRDAVGADRVATLGAPGDRPVQPLAPLLARARLLVAPPLLEPVLEAAALGVPVLIPARSHLAQRRARYLERRLPDAVVVDSLATALARARRNLDATAARDAERETLGTLARAVLGQ